jgi:integrase
MGLDAARDKAVEYRQMLERGEDPAKPVVAAPEVAPMTMAELAQVYYDRHLCQPGKPPKRTAAEEMRRIKKDVLGNQPRKNGTFTPSIVGHVAVKDFSVEHMATVMDLMEDRECFTLANRVFAIVKRMLKLGVRRGVIKFSPLAELEPPHDENVGERFLTVPEIVHLWHLMPKALIRSYKVQLILKIILATGKRSNEVCGARRSEIDWGKRIWTIPASRVKGEEGKVEDEILPLSDFAIALLREAFRISNSEWIFPDDDSDGPYKPGVVSKCVRLALAPADGLPLGRLAMEKWTPHDLRRTVGTQMLNRKNGLGLTKQNKYLALNHKTPDPDDRQDYNAVSDKHYDGNDYADEKREALEKCGAFLERLVTGNVETMEREAA